MEILVIYKLRLGKKGMIASRLLAGGRVMAKLDETEAIDFTVKSLTFPNL